MKTLVTVLALVIGATAWAQQPRMTPEMMQKCFASIDQKALERLGAQAKEMEAEVKRLCAAGDRAGAQNKAIAYGMQMSKDPEMQKMAKCGEGFQTMPGQFFPKDKAEQASRKHICD
jgi:predicted lipoprotein